MEQITNIVNGLAGSLDEISRKKLTDGLRDLSYTLETPHDSLQRIMFAHLQIAAVRIGINLRLFNLLVSTDGPMTVDQLNHKTEAAPLILGILHLAAEDQGLRITRSPLGRLLRYLASFRFIQEVGLNKFTSNNLTKALADPGYQAGFLFLFDTMGPVFQELPDFLAKNHHQNVSDEANTAFQAAHKTSLPGMAWIQEHPQAATHFNDYMAFHRKHQRLCWDVYPVTTETHGWDPDAVVLVDVGGSLGHQCAGFKRQFPQVPGRVVLQDLEIPISTAMSIPGVENMVHDMFTPQPIKEAKFYYLRNILHDWPDDKCCDILRNIVSALGPDSAILLDEMVLPEQSVHWQAAQSDLATMAGLAAAERSYRHWTELLDSVDLKIEKVYEYTPSVYWSIMKVVRK